MVTDLLCVNFMDRLVAFTVVLLEALSCADAVEKDVRTYVRMLIDCKQDRRCAVSCAEVLIAVLSFYRFYQQHHRTKAGRKQQERRGEGLERASNISSEISTKTQRCSQTRSDGAHDESRVNSNFNCSCPVSVAFAFSSRVDDWR